MNFLIMFYHQFIVWMTFYDELFMSFENLVKFYPKIRVFEYYLTYIIMIFPYEEYSEPYEMKNVSSFNACKSIIA